MDYTELVRRASGGEVIAFVELTRRFQHAAFGSALALIGDFQQAEDVVQEAFLAAWSALPRLADAAAFPGWLRTIVRRHAFRLLRQRELPTTTLAAAEEVPSEEPAADRQIEQRQHAHTVLATLSTLPTRLREPAMLFFVHECSHQDIATFLGLTVATVNNRLHSGAYVEHRLRRADWKGDPHFAEDCFPLIHQRTGGVPRQINTLCSRLLLFGFLEERHTLTADAVEQVANDLRQEIAPVTAPPAVASSPAKPDGRDEALSLITRRLDALEDSVLKHERVIKRALEIAASYLKGERP